MNITGKIKIIQEVETFDSGFTKRLLVITTSEKFPQDVPLEFFKEKTGLLDALKVGQVVTIAFNVRGSEWKGKYYTSLNGWKIEDAQAEDIVKPIKDDLIDLPF